MDRRLFTPGTRLYSLLSTLSSLVLRPFCLVPLLSSLAPLKYLRQESNLVLDFRRVECVPAHPEDKKTGRPWVRRDHRCRTREGWRPGEATRSDINPERATAIAAASLLPQPGVEPGPRLSESRMMSVSPPGSQSYKLSSAGGWDRTSDIQGQSLAFSR